MGQRPKFNFFRIWSCCISNLRERRMQQHGSKYFAHTPPPTLCGGVKRSNYTFSEHGHVAYQIKGTMHANILSLQTPSTPVVGQTSTHFFLIVVMLHIKLIGTEHRAPCKQKFCPYTHTRPLGRLKIKGNIHANILSLHTPSTPVVGQTSIHFF